MRKTTILLLILINFGIMNKAYSWSSDYNRAPLFTYTPMAPVAIAMPPTPVAPVIYPTVTAMPPTPVAPVIYPTVTAMPPTPVEPVIYPTVTAMPPTPVEPVIYHTVTAMPPTPVEQVIYHTVTAMPPTPVEPVIYHTVTAMPPTVTEPPINNVVDLMPPTVTEPPLTVEIIDTAQLQAECFELKTECFSKADHLKSQYTALNKQIKLNTFDINRLKESLAQGTGLTLEEEEIQIETPEMKIDRLTIENGFLELSKNDLKNKLEELRNKCSSLNTTCNILNPTPTEHPTQITDPLIAPVYTECQQKLNEIDKQISLEQANYNSYQTMINGLREDLQDLSGSLFAQYEIDRLTASIDEYTALADAILVEINRLERIDEELRLECGD